MGFSERISVIMNVTVDCYDCVTFENAYDCAVVYRCNVSTRSLETHLDFVVIYP